MTSRDSDGDERRPDPHDSALSVGVTKPPMDETAKMRELEEELHNMTEKVASACKSPIHSLFHLPVANAWEFLPFPHS